jgi:hypothetical protein
MKTKVKTKRPRIIESRANRLGRAVLQYSTSNCKLVNERMKLA